MFENNYKVSKDILIVDDTLANLKVLFETLTGCGYEVRAVKNGKTALKAIQAMPPSLILLDINMPEMNGYQLCQILKIDSATRHIPIIFLTASNEAKNKVRAFASGGADYIAKPFQVEEVVARVKNQLAIQSAYAEIRQLNAELEAKVRERTNFLNQKLNELEETKKILHNTFYDSLTDLPNLTSIGKHLEQSILKIRNDKNYGFVVLFINCSWTSLNQSESSLTEHKLILAIVKRILASLGEVDILARIGSSKFVALLPGMQSTHCASQIAEKIHQQFTNPLNITRQQIVVDASIGIVRGNKRHKQYAHILKDAKLAAHQAQKQGKNQYHLFSSSSQKPVVER